MKNFVEELRWRGMLHDMMPETEEMLLNGKSVKGYIGFDPTADSLGVGNLVQIMTLMHFQRCGHQPIALVGGATGLVGDPSGKSAERNMLSPEQINHNLAAQKKQLEKFLDFEGDNPAIIVNNYDWFKDFSFLEFIREAGKHISVNYMMAKDSVKNRLETGMSFTEFCYQLIQGYDFYYLWKNHDVKLQMGGSDQWGNITTGTELIRRKAAGSAFALTTPLIKKSDGTKFGKSEGGNIWLDKTKTSPYKFYQFWLNAADADAENYIKIFSIKTQAEIETLIEEHRSAPHERKLQRALAEEITLRVHSAEDLQAALEASEILFGKATSEQLKRLSDDDFLAVFEGVPQASVSVDRLMGTEVVDVLSELTGFLPSKSEARRALKENSISINKDKIDAEARLNESHLINNKFVLLQRGKKNYFVIRVD
ncbi:MAG TPA: tyrosine--tRNA ligase [Luteibaculaceae bacterium]|nr:tyrosine--tRNA ligase [Luteibaculaceae bacterium]